MYNEKENILLVVKHRKFKQYRFISLKKHNNIYKLYHLGILKKTYWLNTYNYFVMNYIILVHYKCCFMV